MKCNDYSLHSLPIILVMQYYFFCMEKSMNSHTPATLHPSIVFRNWKFLKKNKNLGNKLVQSMYGISPQIFAIRREVTQLQTQPVRAVTSKMYRFPRSIPSLIWSQHGRIHIECRSMSTSEKLWGGRFEKDTDEAAVNWAESLTCDHEMVRCCCIYTKVHALMRTNIRLFRIDE